MASGRTGYEYLSPQYNMSNDQSNTQGISIGVGIYSDEYPDVDFGQCFLDGQAVGDRSVYNAFADELSVFPCSTHQSDVPGLSATVSTPSEVAGFDFSSFLTGGSPPCAAHADQSFRPPCGVPQSRQSSSMGSNFSNGGIKRSPMTPSLDYEIEELPPALWTFPSETLGKDPMDISIAQNSPMGSSSTSSLSVKVKSTTQGGSTSTTSTTQHPKHITSTRKLTKHEAQQVKKAAHSTVEKRYRANLNTKITHLHEELVKASEEDSVSLSSELRGSKSKGAAAGPSKTRKADVLTDALNFVNRTQKEKKMMKEEIDFLKMRIMTLEKLVKCEDCLLLKQMDQMRMPSTHRQIINY